jgi:hypothetical protein
MVVVAAAERGGGSMGDYGGGLEAEEREGKGGWGSGGWCSYRYSTPGLGGCPPAVIFSFKNLSI